MIFKNFAHSEFLLSTINLISILVWFEHLDANKFTGIPFGQVDLGMHSVTNLLDRFDIAFLGNRLTDKFLGQIV